VLECVLENALQVLPAEDICVVIGSDGRQVRAHLGDRYRYAVQERPLGTGDAVRHALRAFGELHGDLLVLYGDTPLFRPASIRGLLNRHVLRKADATLLTAVVDRPLPYGRIIRDAAGNIVDIIEDAEAGERVRAIRELNVGAYVMRADAISREVARLTDCVHDLIRAGRRVESYQIYDPDEVQGINNPDDLAQAEFILQKRLYRPHREEEQNLVTVRHRRLARHHRRRLHHAQRAPPLPGAGQRDHAPRPGKTRRGGGVRPPLPVAAGRRSRRRGVRRQ
jgi:bifunctional N-acetylglucosamine-1-phosphate-uridyltransferase/glucosamine-1-phosphate-acetyltransferase GlmU-like protein